MAKRILCRLSGTSHLKKSSPCLLWCSRVKCPYTNLRLSIKPLCAKLCGSFDGTGIRQLVDDWVENLKTDQTDDAPLEEQLFSVGESLRALSGMDLNFANALIGLADNRLRPPRSR